MRKKPEVMRAKGSDGRVALLLVRGHGLCDSVVEATIERLELVGGDRESAFMGELRDTLADAPVVVNDLSHSKTHPQELAAVQRRALGDLFVPTVAKALLRTQDPNELVQKDREPVCQLRVSRRGDLTSRELQPRASQHLLMIRREELVEQQPLKYRP